MLGEAKTLYPDMRETLRATETLVKEGFLPMVYCVDDPIAAKQLEEAGAVAIMPLGAPIGSGLGVQNPVTIRLIVEQSKVPVLVDAGVGTASDAAVAMELGCDGVLMNTAIAEAKDPVLMAQAMKAAVEAGRLAYLAGRMPRRETITICLLKFVTDPVWWFFLFWLPKFLNERYGLSLLDGGWDAGGPIDATWIVFYLGVGLAALHPSMVSLSEPTPPSTRLTRTRLALLAGASLMAPAVLVIQTLRDEPVDVGVEREPRAPVPGRPRGPVEAESVSGPVQASGVTGDLSARTVSGDLTVAEGGGGSVRAKTVSGAVTIDLQASGDRDINLTSVSGDLTVRLPETSDLQVKLQSTSGQVSSAFEQLERDRTPGRYTAWGRLGAGTGRLRAASTSGHVALLRRAPEASL